MGIIQETGGNGLGGMSALSGQRFGISPEAINAPLGAGQRKPGFNHSSFQLFHPASGRAWWLKEGENKIGRGFENDIVVTDLSVSRAHARIYVDGSYVYIKDLNSTNGVFVAGSRVHDALLSLDALFKLGKVELVLIKPVQNDTEKNNWSALRD